MKLQFTISQVKAQAEWKAKEGQQILGTGSFSLISGLISGLHHFIFQHILVSLLLFISSLYIKSNSCYHLLTKRKAWWTSFDILFFSLYSGFLQKPVLSV